MIVGIDPGPLRCAVLPRPDGDGEADRIAPGTQVIIKRGAFATRLRIVAMASRDRVRLLLECFGGHEIAVSFALADVEGDQPTIGIVPI